MEDALKLCPFFSTACLISHLTHLSSLSFWDVHIVFLSRFCSCSIEPHFQNEFCKLGLPSQHHCLPTYLADSDTDRKFPGSMYGLCANFVSFPLKLVIYKILVSYLAFYIIFLQKSILKESPLSLLWITRSWRWM